MICSKCGRDVPNDANLCPYCWNALTLGDD
ncbi:MAG: zinc-ribbon domain-containing protein [Clostridia bacterium]|nr:zinc-ribbon domain-containing protein [Clostridia bacterium]